MVLVYMAGQQDTDALDVVADEFVEMEFLVDRADDPRRVLATRLGFDSRDQRMDPPPAAGPTRNAR